MAKETFTGPLLVLGGLAGNLRLPPAGSGSGVGFGPPEYSDEIGPSLFWGGVGFPATGAVASKDRTGPGTIPCVTGAYPVKTLNAVLVLGAANLTVAGLASTGVPLTNIATYAAGVAPVPVPLPGGLSAQGLGLDMGLDAATFATTGTVTLTTIANAWRYNKPGLWLALLNGGLAGSCLFTQVQSVNLTTGVLTVSPAPAVNGTGQITLTNRYNPNLYGAGAPTGVSSEAPAGSARISIPELGNGRGVGVKGVAGVTAGIPVLIQGLDCFGSPTSEIILTGAGATTVWGKKTYDIFISATPQAPSTANVQIVTSDLIGLPMSVLSGNSIYSVALGGTASTPGTNYTVIPADLTNPATTTTGDPRGGIQLTGNGPGAAPGTPLVLDGVKALTIYQVLDPLQVALATGINPGALLGVPSV